jgi:hypothetical protein
LETRRVIDSTITPKRDLIDLYWRFRDLDQPDLPSSREGPWDLDLGESHTFWIENKDNHKKTQISATLNYETPHAYFFVEDGLVLNEEALIRLALRFENQTYPTNRDYFGSEWSPGVDGDPHIFILFAAGFGESVSAYQSSLDEYPQVVYPYSNEKEILYISAAELNTGEQAIDCLLAHEFQHIIRWAVDPGEDTWLNEAHSEAACLLNDVRASYSDLIVKSFANQPDTQLNTWGGEPDSIAAQYGASFMFITYFLERLGEEAIRIAAADQVTGIESLEYVLASLDPDITFDELFADWLLANYLNDPLVEGGLYAYDSLIPPTLANEAEYKLVELPQEREATVNQYAADYILVHGEGNYELEFAGSNLVGVAPVFAHSGDHVWWSGRETNGDATLTREFDLTGLEHATLKFFTWYDVEQDFDYAYILASKDGHHWQTLSGLETTPNNPVGTNYGPGYTGVNRDWIQEQIDLTPFAGDKVQLRFEYITDDGPTAAGFFLDDIEIPELAFYDDAETQESRWLSKGFMRIAPILPQKWLLQLVTLGVEETSVSRLSLEPDNRGNWTVELGSGEAAVWVVSGITRSTAEPASYHYRITQSAE